MGPRAQGTEQVPLIRRVLRAAQGGLTATEIAAQTRVPETTIQHWLNAPLMRALLRDPVP